MNKIKRFIAVVLSAVLLISTCSVSLTLALQGSGASGYDVELRTEENYATFTYSDDDYAALGNNLLSGKTATPYIPNGDGTRTLVTNLDAAATKLPMLTDGVVSDNGTGASRALLFLTGGGEAGAVPKLDLEYDLGYICSIEKFVLMSVQNPRDFSYYSKFYTGEYEVYLSDSKDDLYNAENLIYSYNYKDESIRSGVQAVTFNEAVRGQYLAVRILNPVSPLDTETVSTAATYPRIAEIGVFGEKVLSYTVRHRTEDNYSTFTYSNDAYAALGNNLLSGKTPTPYIPNDDGTHTLISNLDSAATKLPMLTDGAVSDTGTGASRALLFLTGGGEAGAVPKLDLEYDLGSICSIEKFVLMSVQNPRDFSYYSKFYTGEYEVYISDSKEDLYNSKNLVYSYNYEDESVRSGVQEVTFNEAVTGQYLAIRILNPVSPLDTETVSTAATYPRIAEIGVFGESLYTVEHRTEENYTTFTYSDSSYAALGTNLVGGKIATPFAINGDNTRTEITNLDNQAAKLGMLTDGAVTDDGTDASWAKLYYTGGSAAGNIKKLDLEYDLGSTCTVEKFVFISIQNPRDFAWHSARYIGKYEVYLADSKDDLYNAENLIYSYDYKTQSKLSGVQAVNFTEAQSGKYLAVRILDPLSSDHADGVHIYPRIAEIGLFGTEGNDGDNTSSEESGSEESGSEESSSEESSSEESSSEESSSEESSSDNTSSDNTSSDNTPVITYTDNEYAALGTNLLSGKIAKPYDSAHTAITNLDNQAVKLGMLTDGIVVDDGIDSTWAKLYYQGGAVAGNITYLDLEYNLGSICTVDKFVFVSIQNTKDQEWHSARYIGKYEVYLSDSKTDLYSAENLIYSYDYKNESKLSGVQTVNFSEAVKGKYLAIRILDPISAEHIDGTHIYPRIAEIGLFGKDGIEDVEHNYTVEYRTENNQETFTLSDADYAALGTNLLSGRVAKAFDITHTPVTNLDNQAIKLGMLTDGIIADDGKDSTWSKLYYYGGAESGNITYLDLEYNLGSICTVDKFVFASIQNTKDFLWHSERYIGKYEVYLSEDQADLYKKENLIYSYDYETMSKPSGVQMVTFKEAVKGKYLAVRILDPISAEHIEGTHIYPRIAEIGLFGEDGLSYTVEYRKENKLSDMFTDKEYAALGNNLLGGRVAAPYVLNIETGDRKSAIGNDAKNENINGGTDTLVKLTDGVVYDGTAGITAGLYYHGGEAIGAIDLEYNLGSICKIEKFALLGSSYIYENNIVYSMGRYTGKYEVYLSNGKEDLYNPANLIYSYDYESDGTARGQIVTFKNVVEGQYLGIRILDPVTTESEYVYPRISEIGVFGTDGLNYTIEYISEPVDGPVMTNKEFAAIGESIIRGASPRLLLNGVANSTLEWQNSGNLLNDGDLSQSTNFRWVAAANGETYVDIIYELGEDPYDFEKFAFIGYKNPWKHYYTGHYQVYVAMEYDELFLEDTLVYEYDRSVDMVARGQIVTFKEKPRGCYLAVRILDPNMLEFDHNDEDHLWIAPKISEIGAYGTKAEIIAEPMNLAVHMPVDAYLTEKDGKLSKLSSARFTSTDIKMLTDGDINTRAVIETGGKELTLLYNLCKDMSIDEILIHATENTEFKLNAVRIYASNDINGVWSSDSLVFSSDDLKAVTNGAKFDSSKKVRYVRIVVPASSAKYCAIGEIEIVGMDNQKLKYKNLALSVAPSFIQAFAKNNKNGFVSYLNVDSNTARGLVDNDKRTVATVEGGNPSRESLNLQMYLGDLKTVSSISLHFKDIEAYLPTKLYVYLCQSEDEVLGNDVEPAAVFDGMPKDGVYQIDINPTLARYIRICIPDGNPLQTDYDTYCIGFTEISIMGTAAVGTQTDSENDALLSYSNSEYNISWDVVRIDTNDISTEIADSKIKKSSVTDAQKASLSTAMYKIVTDALYEIEFYNIWGEKLEDIQGRNVRIRLPISEEYLGGNMLFGDASDPEVIELYETLESYEEGSSPYIYFELTEEDGYAFVVTQLTDYDDPYWDFMPDSDEDLGDNDTNADDGSDVWDDTSSDEDADIGDDTASDDSDDNSNIDTDSDDGSDKDTDADADKDAENKTNTALPIIIIGAAALTAGVAATVVVLIKKRK